MQFIDSLTVLGASQGITGVPPGRWLLAASPVLVLLGLVLWGRWSTLVNALLTVAVAVTVGMMVFGADPLTVGVGLGKGAWVGLWILYVIGPALLMHHLATRMGMKDLGAALSFLLPTRTATVLLLAWVLPSFIQGVSGFGTPIAMAAPLLVAVGVEPVRAVALSLIGYHWAVGFGSMGSSFYMGALTARLDAEGIAAFATSGAIVLGINCILAGVLVAFMYDGWRGLREGAWMLAVAGPIMATVQFLVAQLEPGIASLCGGAAGIGAVFIVRWLPHPEAATSASQLTDAPPTACVQATRSVSAVPIEQAHGAAAGGRDGDASGGGAQEYVRARAADAAVPYFLLAAIALTVFLPPAMREWAKNNLLFGPSFPATTGGGDQMRNEAVTTYNPIALLGHPGTVLLLACLGSLLVWWARGRWRSDAWRPVLRDALRQTWKTAPAVILLASVAGVLVDTGMVLAMAQGLAAATGSGYPLVAPFVGAIGSFITGSTTNSNALFSALQAEVAGLLGQRPADLLAGQLAGGNIGNALAPVVILLGLSAVGAGKQVGKVLRLTLLPATVLLASAVAVTWLLVVVNG